MDLTSAKNTAISALNSNQILMNLSAQNIANANNKDYVRRVAMPTTSGNLSIGNTVSIEKIQRAVDFSLQKELLIQEGKVSYSEQLMSVNTRIEKIMGDPNSNDSLPMRINKLFNSINTLSANTTGSVNMYDVIQQLVSVTDSMQKEAVAIEELQSNIKTEFSNEVEKLNSYLKEVHELNTRIKNNQGAVYSNMDLLDQRDKKLKDIAKIVGIRVSQGRVYLYQNRNCVT